MTTVIVKNSGFSHLNGASQTNLGLRIGIDLNQLEGIYDVTVDNGDTYPTEGVLLDFSSIGWTHVYAVEVISNDFDNYRTITYVDTTDYDPSLVRARLVLASNTEESGTLGNGDATFTIKVKGD